jgi:basic membrane protein A
MGVIGPIETGDAKLYVEGFKAGVMATNSDAVVNVTWIGSFSDVALASEAAQTHINAGADVLTGTAQMVVGAIGVARQKGVLWFGTQADQTSLAPEIVVGNQIYDWTVVLKSMIDLIKEGTLGGKAYALTLANGGLKITVNDQAIVGQTINDIIEGKIDLNLGEIH